MPVSWHSRRSRGTRHKRASRQLYSGRASASGDSSKSEFFCITKLIMSTKQDYICTRLKYICTHMHWQACGYVYMCICAILFECGNYTDRGTVNGGGSCSLRSVIPAIGPHLQNVSVVLECNVVRNGSLINERYRTTRTSQRFQQHCQ